MTKILWCRAMPRLFFSCVLLAGCNGDGAGDGDTAAATETGGPGDGTTEGSPGTDGAAPGESGTTAPGETGTTAGSDDAPDGTAAATDDDGSGGSTDDDGGSSTGGAALEIVGAWLEVFPGGGGMQTHTITEESWLTSSEFGDALHHIESWDAEARVLVAQSDAANAFNPELWGKFEWQYVDGTLHYCQSVYDAETAEDAWAAAGAELADLEAGCGGFPWSPLEPK